MKLACRPETGKHDFFICHQSSPYEKTCNSKLLIPGLKDLHQNPIFKIRKLIAGLRNLHNNPPPKNNSAKIMKKPILPMLKYLYIASSGKKEATIFEPSRGGTGIKLNSARNIFIIIALTKIALTTPQRVMFADE